MRGVPSVRVFPHGALLGALAVLAFNPQIGAQADVRERTLFASAVDEKGEPVADLGPADFVVREDGVRREVLRVSRAVEPIDIALLVDNSASADGAIIHMRDGLTRFISLMTPQNQIALIGLADRPTILVDYTSDARRLREGVGRLFPMSQSGMTLLDAVVETSRGMERRESSRAVIVPVLNDGVEFTNRYARGVIESLTSAGAALHAVTVGRFQITDDTTRERAFLLDGGTRNSGGQRVDLLTPMAVPSTLEKLARELSAQYKVVYSRPESLIPPDKLDVASAKAGITVRATPVRTRAGA